MWDSTMFLSTLTPKFYVALTGTSSLISGLILIFEWWYFRKYGTSFIEQVSLNHISPWLSGEPNALAANQSGDALTNGPNGSPAAAANGPNNGPNGGASGLNAGPNGGNGGANNGNGAGSGTGANSSNSFNQSHSQIPECKMWRNPMALLRGAEYQRFYWATQKEPLTFNDMNISAQDHQTFFTCEGDAGRPEYEIMQTAWRERNPVIRIKAARSALDMNALCTPAYILLAEEEATSIREAEMIFTDALVVAEGNYRSHFVPQNAVLEGAHKRDTNCLIYIKRRLAMCARKLQNNTKAAKIFRDLTKEIAPIVGLLNVHENLMEAMLEDGNYSDCAAVLAKFDDISLPKSATICYTAALLKARCVADKFSAERASRHGLSAAELVVVEAIHRAVEFNPHVPKYLLEQKSLIFPPEHILKRGDSEALAYAFAHLRHWKRVEGALNMLFCTWEGTFRMLPYPLERGHLFYPYPACTECADRELLPVFHEVSVYPRKELPFFILFTAGLCTFTAMLAMATHQYPEPMAQVAQSVMNFLTLPYVVLKERLEFAWPCNLMQQLSRI